MYSKIKTYIPWNLIDFIFVVTVLSVIARWVFGPETAEQHATGMIASAALFTAMQNSRKLKTENNNDKAC